MLFAVGEFIVGLQIVRTDIQRLDRQEEEETFVGSKG
jgi:hypothetical protein